MKRILVINGHPDPDRSRFNYQLANAYIQSALSAGIHIKEISVADLDFSFITTYKEFYSQDPESVIIRCQEKVAWADHILILYPLWLGGMPALLKGFFEQVMRPEFGFSIEEKKSPKKFLKGKTARIVVTMGMPTFIYRWYYFAHSIKSFRRNILNFCGIKPVKYTLIGRVENQSKEVHQHWLAEMHRLGKAGI